jgi:beta-galactosidase
LIGTFPAGSYARNHSPATREFFAGLLVWAGLQPKLRSSDQEVQVRLHQGTGGTYAWVVNPTRAPRTVKITLPSAFQKATEIWQEGGASPTVSGNVLSVSVGDRDAAVVRLE